MWSVSSEKRDKFGLAICNHCSNEIKENVGHQRYVNFYRAEATI